jgi:pyruvate kinase
LIIAKKSSAKIIAKIETPEALNNLEQIVKEADGIMVARGDLGVEIPAHKVPIAQKRMIALANRHSKPVITATQVLQSMVDNPRPTRAEISDAANAVFDHTDAIMLSNETSTGNYPFKAATTLKKVALEVEADIEKHKELRSHFSIEELQSDLFGASLQACETAEKENAKFLVVYSETGEEAREIAKLRPTTELIIITSTEQIARELTLTWGANRIFVKKMPEKNRPQQIIKFLQKNSTISKKYKIVIAA